MRTGSVLAAGIFAAAAAAGCGVTPERRGESHAQFVASANAVCGHELAKLAFVQAHAQRLRRSLTSPAVIRQQAAQSQLATARLEGLPEPPADVSTIRRWLGARTVAATVALDLAEAPARGSARAVADVRAELATTLARARALAIAYGSQVCGETD